ncbi:MAG: glycosyltransferase [Bacteroidales bacterium]|nr:glycosyltransferase [Bacteroidales bacterium]
MRILLLGDYSNVHHTLAEGLKALGHECVVASDGDHWKDYPRDIDLRRQFSFFGNVSFLWRLLKALPTFKDYDIVQLINPLFLEMKPESVAHVFRYIRRHNKKVVLGAFGMDYYWASVNSSIMPLRYSDFNIGKSLRTDSDSENYLCEWTQTRKKELCEMVAKKCDAIVSGLYEYHLTYENTEFRDKTFFIPFPIQIPHNSPKDLDVIPEKLRLFVGLPKDRVSYKGLDIMLSAAKAVQGKYPNLLDIKVASALPFASYQEMMNGCDAILDQLYSYTPGMNALLAMSKGIVCIGGGEPENYEILGEKSLRPIINVLPSFDSCYKEIENLVLHRELLHNLKRQSIEYVKKHHDYIKVAELYLERYAKL